MGETGKVSLLEKFHIPIDHLDFKYIENCNDARELGQILRILKSGEEGYYPDLTKCCEKKLECVDPKNKMLQKECKPVMSSQLSPDQRDEIIKDLDTSVQRWKELDSEIKHWKIDPSMHMPDIRHINSKPKPSQRNEYPERQTGKRISSYDHSGWDKYDVEAELEKLNVEEKKVPMHIPKVDFSIDVSECSAQEKERIADSERKKGNEAYAAGDYSEAETYYNRSVSVCASAITLNNRAQACIKMKKYNSAIEDCNQVLRMEPDNIKALLRRGVAYKNNFNFEQAVEDFEKVMQINPESAVAQRFLKEIRDTFPQAKGKQKRVLIEEI